MPSSHHNNKGHRAGFAAAKAPLKPSSQGSMRSQRQEDHTRQVAEARSAPNIVFSINNENKDFEESQY